jgi:hypothetical protein
VVAAWQGEELLRAVYAASDLAYGRAALEPSYRWTGGVAVAELSRLARTVRVWEVEILAFHATDGCPTSPTTGCGCSCMAASGGRLTGPTGSEAMLQLW